MKTKQLNIFLLAFIIGTTTYKAQTGNVGVGTTTPQERLHVVGGQLGLHGPGLNGLTNPLERFVLYADQPNGLLFEAPLIGTAKQDIRFSWRGVSLANPALFIKGLDGSVGIGTTNPSAKLEVGWPSLTSFKFDGSASTSSYVTTFNMDNTALKISHNSSSRNLVLGAANRNDITILGNNGNVGIGTTIPNQTLDVDVGNVASGNKTVAYFGGQTSGATATSILLSNRNSAGSSFLAFTQDASTGTQTPAFIERYGTAHTSFAEMLRMQSSGALSFWTGGSNPRMTILANGNIGIGTTGPNAPLQFANTTANRKVVLFESVNNDHQFFGFGINSSVLRYQTSSTAGDHVFYASATATTSNELMRIKGTGFVGIGVNPTEKFHIRNTLVQRFARFESPLFNFYIEPEGSGNEVFLTYAHNNSAYTSRHLHLSVNNSNQDFVLERDIVANQSQVGINKTNPAYALDVNGDAQKNTGGANWIFPSDKRIKKNIVAFDDGLNIIRQIEPVKYEYNGALGTKQNEQNYGVIAQEMKRIAPYTVKTIKEEITYKDLSFYSNFSDIRFKGKDSTNCAGHDENGNLIDMYEVDILTYDHSAINFVVINAIKELDKIIEKQNIKITELENKLAAIEQKK